MKHLIHIDSDGSFWLEQDKSIDIKSLPTAVYCAICKLKDYERSNITPDEVERLDYENRIV